MSITAPLPIVKPRISLDGCACASASARDGGWPVGCGIRASFGKSAALCVERERELD